MLKIFFTACVFCALMTSTVFAFTAEDFLVIDIPARDISARDSLTRDSLAREVLPRDSFTREISTRESLAREAFIAESFVPEPFVEDSPAEDFSIKDFFELEEMHEIGMFKITNGSLSGMESTFNDILTISGQAPRDTIVTISVYVQDENDSDLLINKDFFELFIGSSGIFSHIINLSMGENYILIYAYNDGDVTFIRTVINRRDNEIKQELSRGLAFPGRNMLSRRVADLS